MPVIPISTLLNTTSQQQLVTENGRQYLQGYNAYPFPCDETEDKRLDALEVIWKTAFRSLFQALLPPREGRRYRILDLGSGTGAWCAGVARARSDFYVVGVDLCEPAEGLFPWASNCTFLHRFDFENPDWSQLLGDGKFDLVRCGMLAGAVSDWRLLLQRIRSVLKPGGQVEIVEIDWVPRYKGRRVDDMPENSRYVEWFQMVEEVSRESGKPIMGAIQTIQREIVFVGFDAECTRQETLWLSAGCRAYDEEMHRIIDDRHAELFIDPELGHLEALSMRLLTQRGYTEKEVRDMCNIVRAELVKAHNTDPALRPFHRISCITARRT